MYSLTYLLTYLLNIISISTARYFVNVIYISYRNWTRCYSYLRDRLI